MTKRFQKAYNALVDAYFDKTLQAGSCTACACGNIIRDAMGVLPTASRDELIDKVSFWIYGVRYWNDPQMHERHKKMITDLTGYSPREFMCIETAFESNTRFKAPYINPESDDIDQDIFRGLMAVVDVMIKLDDIKEEKLKEGFREGRKLELV